MNICVLILFIVAVVLFLQIIDGKKMGGAKATYEDVDKLLTDLESKHKELAHHKSNMELPYASRLNQILILKRGNNMFSSQGYKNEVERLQHAITNDSRLQENERKELLQKLKSHT